MSQIGLDQTRITTPRYIQIAEELRSRISEGAFGGSGQLPTTRAMARRLRVNRNTVVAAYSKLEEWGVARGHVGRGTFAVRAPSRSSRAMDFPPGSRDSPQDARAPSSGKGGSARGSRTASQDRESFQSHADGSRRVDGSAVATAS